MQEETTEQKKRTNLQNKSIHKLIALYCEEMMNNGNTLNELLKEGWEIQPTPEAFKAIIVQPLCKYICGSPHTSDLNSKQVDELYDILNKNIGEKIGIHIPFPSIEEQMTESLDSYAQEYYQQKGDL